MKAVLFQMIIAPSTEYIKALMALYMNNLIAK